ncbi:MAG: metallophosphoesterase, partial [Cellulosilyticaceae bacterium]
MFKFIKSLFKALFLTLFTLALLGAAVFFYSLKIEPNLLKTTTHQLYSTSGELDGLRIVQFSDTHVGAFYDEADMQRLVDKINSLEPDIIVFTGDLVDNWAKYHNRKALYDIMSQLNAPFGKFAVYGNHDYGGGGTRLYKAFMEACGFELLVNTSKHLTLSSGGTITISGLDDLIFGNPNIEKVVQGRPAADYQLILVHEPDIADAVAPHQFHLQLSGHSHGGQVSIPGLPHELMPPYGELYTEG